MMTHRMKGQPPRRVGPGAVRNERPFDPEEVRDRRLVAIHTDKTLEGS